MLLAVMIMFVVSPTFGSVNRPFTIHITGDFPIDGQISVQVFQSLDDFFNSHPVLTIEETVTTNVILISVTNLPPGSYIINVLHDKNRDGKMNSNAFGMPIESSVFVAPDAAGDPVKPSKALFQYDGSTSRYDVSLDAPAFEASAWSAGVMAIVSSSPYRGGDTEVRVLPLISFIGEKLFVTGPRAGYNLFKNQPLSVNVFAEYKFASDAFEDEKYLEGMKKRRDTVMSGVDASLRFKSVWRLESNMATDILDRHNGQEANLTLSRLFRFEKFSLTPGAGLVWRSDDYNQYYYGVREEEATPDRPAYEPGSSLDWLMKISTRYALDDDWSILGIARVEFLSDDIQDSPIINKETVTSAFLGLNYAF